MVGREWHAGRRGGVNPSWFLVKNCGARGIGEGGGEAPRWGDIIQGSGGGGLAGAVYQ